MFSPDGTLISASAAPHCGGPERTESIVQVASQDSEHCLCNLSDSEHCLGDLRGQ